MPGRQLGGERRSAGEKRPVCQRARLEAKREWPPGFLKIQGTQTFISYRDLWVMKATPDTCEKACQDLSPQLPRDLTFSSSNHGHSPHMKDDCLGGKKSHQKSVLALSDLGILGHRTVRK